MGEPPKSLMWDSEYTLAEFRFAHLTELRVETMLTELLRREVDSLSTWDIEDFLSLKETLTMFDRLSVCDETKLQRNELRRSIILPNLELTDEQEAKVARTAAAFDKLKNGLASPNEIQRQQFGKVNDRFLNSETSIADFVILMEPMVEPQRKSGAPKLAVPWANDHEALEKMRDLIYQDVSKKKAIDEAIKMSNRAGSPEGLRDTFRSLYRAKMALRKAEINIT